MKNIRFAAGKLVGLNDQEASRYNFNIPQENQLIYLRFDVNETYKAIKTIEEDSTIVLLDYPFADVEIFRRADNGENVNVENLRDGMIYASVPITNLSSLGSINYQVLDTLYYTDDDEDNIVTQSLIETGFLENNPERIFCSQRLRGFVRHEDFYLRSIQPVKGMQVFYLFFGAPFRTFTNQNGYYESRQRFRIGTFVFTKAANPLILVKPINDSERDFFSNIGNIVTNFIIGSVTAHGWVSCREMRNGYNIEYTGVTQRNYWCHIMNAIAMHHTYMINDNMPFSTPRRLVTYARWSRETGAASAPMLNKMFVTDELLLSSAFSFIFGFPSNGVVAPFYLLFAELTPDITIRRSPNGFSSNEVIQTMFHEFGHAAHFQRAGTSYWLAYIWQIISNSSNNPCGTIYGCGNEVNAGVVQVGEAWAEFIGTEHAQRYHPNAMKCSRFFAFTTGNCLVNYSTALENERWFEANFIPTGFFHDLRDNFNIDEPWDLVQGVTIKQMYLAFTPETTHFCFYINSLLNQNSSLNFANLKNTDNSRTCNF